MMEPVTSGIVIELEHVALLAVVNFVLMLVGLVRVRAEAFEKVLKAQESADAAHQRLDLGATGDADPK